MIRIPKPLTVALRIMLVVSVGIPLPTLSQVTDGTATVLTGARLIDGTGNAPLEASTLVIRNGRIEAVGESGEVSAPADATVVDLSGRTILPGWVNAHGHLNVGDSGVSTRDRLVGQLRLYADYGVTTVVVLGIGAESLATAVRLSEEQASGDLDRARVYVAGPSLQNLRMAEEARSRVNGYADAGADIVKIHITGSPNDTPPEVYRALIDQAHNRGLRVASHLYYLEDAHGLVDAGVDVIAHSVRDQDVDTALIDKIKRRGVAYIPTLTRDLAQFVYESTPAFFGDPFFLRRAGAYRREVATLSDPAYQERIRNSSERQAVKRALEQGMRNLKTLSDAGVLIALGSDSGTNEGQWQGYFEHRELEMMVEAGLSPMQALVAATGAAARAVGLDGELGTLQPGRWADLLVLHANPIDDIRATREIDSVWIAGRRLADVP